MKVIYAGLILTLCAAHFAVAEDITTSPNVKRISTGICYARGERGYDDARNFKTFDSLEACIEAGGRRPNLTGWGFLGKNSQSASSASSLVPVMAPAPAAAPVASAKPAGDKSLFDTATTTIVKKSRSGICYEAANPSYADIENFTAYRTVDDCLQSGGKALSK
ncbi:MAG: hypothetical protein QM808_17300 [Steroidobacteraceae bacterium]